MAAPRGRASLQPSAGRNNWARYAERLEAGYAVGAEELHDLAHVNAWPRVALGPCGCIGTRR